MKRTLATAILRLCEDLEAKRSHNGDFTAGVQYACENIRFLVEGCEAMTPSSDLPPQGSQKL